VAKEIGLDAKVSAAHSQGIFKGTPPLT
jgi:hypothetical protein